MNQFSMLEPCPSSFSGRDGSGPLATSKTKNTEETCLRVDFQCSRVIFNVRTCVKFTFANEIEAVYERSLVSVKVEPRSTSRLCSALFILPLFYLRDWNLRALPCVTVRYRALPCVSKNASVPGNQPWEGETELLDWAVMRDTALIYETRHGLNDNMDNKCHGNEKRSLVWF